MGPLNQKLGRMVEWNTLIKTVIIIFVIVCCIFFTLEYFLFSIRKKRRKKINIEKNMKEINSISINELNKMNIQSM